MRFIPVTHVMYTMDGDLYTSTEPVDVTTGPRVEFLVV
jgi:hypothetical protein